jgi:hypothetical protein
MSKVNRETAEAEINSWLDFKKISEKKRTNYKENIESLVDAVCEGILSVNPEGKELVQILNFPIGEEMKVNKLEYKPRLTVGAVQSHLNGVKATDADGRIIAYIAALTSQPKELIKKMDTEDNGLAQSIAVFFL